jgi:hypothetical protein
MEGCPVGATIMTYVVGRAVAAIAIVSSLAVNSTGVAIADIAPSSSSAVSDCLATGDYGSDLSFGTSQDGAVVGGTSEQPATTCPTSTDEASDSLWDYRFRENICSDASCLAVSCPEPDQVGYLIERRLTIGAERAWRLNGFTCATPDGPVITPGMVLEEVRRIGLPSMSVEVPPETLVNYDTVVYTEAETFARTVSLLGFTVDVEATPSQFHWTYDDGTTETTTTAGRPYPAKDITHTWADAHRTFHPSVDVTYQIRFRIDGGDWQTLADTITIQGPEGNVRIREATGMLTDMR